MLIILIIPVTILIFVLVRGNKEFIMHDNFFFFTLPVVDTLMFQERALAQMSIINDAWRVYEEQEEMSIQFRQFTALESHE